MFARFAENPAMTLEDIKETKRYERTDTRTHSRTHGQRENSIPTTNKVCGGYNKYFHILQRVGVGVWGAIAHRSQRNVNKIGGFSFFTSNITYQAH